MQKIVPCLWFDGRLEEAMSFYASIFPDTRILEIQRYSEVGPGPAGTVLSATFELNGVTFIGINGGSEYSFTPAISFAVRCETQEEVDTLWEKFLDGGQPIMCGWLTDRFGVTWQIVPTVLDVMLADEDPEKANRVMEAMLKMVKLNIAELEAAYRGS